MARSEIIHGHRVGLLISRTECFALGLVLNENPEPRKSTELKERAQTIIDYWGSKGINPLYPIDGKVMSLGLRKLRRYGLAVTEGRKWKLTEEGQRAVVDAATP